MNSQLLNDITKNEPRAVSRLISLVENGDDDVEETVNSLFPYAQDAIRIGITGPPGAGKSTLIDKIIGFMRKDDKSVGIVSVDPTSPFSGGALLGDRVRMHRHALDKDVFIRSMGTRGQTGGLAKMSHIVGDIIACTGKDYVLFETVGVGQVEMEIVQNVDITVVMFVPESGDEIQFMKAGPVEVGDIFVINKADREGSGRIAKLLQDYVDDSFKEREFVPKIFLTVATAGTGVEDLYTEFARLVGLLEESGMFSERRHHQYAVRVQNEVRLELLKRFWSEDRLANLNARIEQLREKNISPYEAAWELISDLS